MSDDRYERDGLARSERQADLPRRGWPELNAGNHWRGEIIVFQANAVRRYAPSMRQRINPDELCATAVRQIRLFRYRYNQTLPPPEGRPVTLDQPPRSSRTDLEAAFA